MVVMDALSHLWVGLYAMNDETYDQEWQRLVNEFNMYQDRSTQNVRTESLWKALETLVGCIQVRFDLENQDIWSHSYIMPKREECMRAPRPEANLVEGIHEVSYYDVRAAIRCEDNMGYPALVPNSLQLMHFALQQIFVYDFLMGSRPHDEPADGGITTTEFMKRLASLSYYSWYDCQSQ